MIWGKSYWQIWFWPNWGYWVYRVNLVSRRTTFPSRFLPPSLLLRKPSLSFLFKSNLPSNNRKCAAFLQSIIAFSYFQPKYFHSPIQLLSSFQYEKLHVYNKTAIYISSSLSLWLTKKNKMKSVKSELFFKQHLSLNIYTLPRQADVKWSHEWDVHLSFNRIVHIFLSTFVLIKYPRGVQKGVIRLNNRFTWGLRMRIKACFSYYMQAISLFD